MKKCLLFAAILLVLFAVGCSKVSSDMSPARLPLQIHQVRHKVTQSDIQDYILNIKGIHPTKAAEVTVFRQELHVLWLQQHKQPISVSILML